MQPGYLVNSQLPARYFLEVNAGELDGIEPGILVSVEYLVTEGMTPVASDPVSAMVPFIGFLMVSAVSILMMRDMVKDDSFFDSVAIHRLGPNLSIYRRSELKALE